MYPFLTQFYRNKCTVNTHHLSYRNQSCREIIAVYTENRTKEFYKLWVEVEFYSVKPGGICVNHGLL